MKANASLRRAFRGRRVLITGGLGFIGSNLARELVALGARVTILDALIPEYGGNRRNLAGLGRKVRVHIGDVRERAFVLSHFWQSICWSQLVQRGFRLIPTQPQRT